MLLKLIAKLTLLTKLLVHAKQDVKLLSTAVNKMSSPIITVSEGQLKGAVNSSFDGVSYYSFKGIPYAQPPVGDLRFKAPLPPKPWKGIYEAIEHGPICPQLDVPAMQNVEGDENCLFLNVYTKTLNSDSKTPVMVFIHGGAFMYGSGNSDFYGPDYFMLHDVVLVTLNYRLEVLGFLRLDTPEVPGNAGMKDQVAALRWVKKNIAKFGGDPDNITLFGESAGAASVTCHMLSPMSKGLFHKAIAQSGVSVVDWAIGKEAKERAFRIGKVLGKETDNTQDLLNFLQSVPFGNLTNKLTLKTATKDERHRGLPMHFIPVVEKKFDNVEAFLTEDPLEMLQAKKAANIPLMLGFNSNEGILMVSDTLKKLDFLNAHSSFLVPREIARKVTEDKMKNMGERIKNYYSGNRNFTKEDVQSLCDMNSDMHFTYSIHRFAHLYSALNIPMYMYRFGCDTELNFFKIALGMTDLKGACHADELFYLFSSAVTADAYKEKENLRRLVYRVTKLWVDFARTGNPLPENSENVHWQPYSSSTKEFLNIDDKFTSGQYAEKDRVEFWDKLYCEAGLPYIGNKSHL